VLDDGSIIEGLVYCDIGDHRYWTMGWPVEEETVINREVIETSTVRFIDPQSIERTPGAVRLRKSNRCLEDGQVGVGSSG
jgi:hypothetical protein